MLFMQKNNISGHDAAKLLFYGNKPTPFKPYLILKLWEINTLLISIFQLFNPASKAENAATAVYVRNKRNPGNKPCGKGMQLLKEINGGCGEIKGHPLIMASLIWQS